MTTLKLTIFKAKVLKDGRHKIRVAVCHKHETCYIVTNFVIDNEWVSGKFMWIRRVKVVPLSHE